MSKAWLLPALLMIAGSTAAIANGTDDGNAGLDAFNRGSYDEAIRLFTRALNDSTLLPDDREFAFVSRGKAFLAERNYDRAASDFTAAMHLKPGDADARGGLASAHAGPTGAAVAQSTPGIPYAGGWGLLAGMVDKYYWGEVAGASPPTKYLHASWSTPGELLVISVRSRKGPVEVGEYKRDKESGKLLAAVATADSVYYCTATVGADGSIAQYCYINNQAVMLTNRRNGDDSITQYTYKYVNGSWQRLPDVRSVEVSEDTLKSRGLLKSR